MMLFGEAFDKIARVIGLGYPGGPKVDKLAQQGEANIELPKTHFQEETFDFSFSGIKTAVINTNHNKKDIKKEDLCASFEKAVTDMLLQNTEKALDLTKLEKLALAGGVSANSYIREKFLELGKEENVKDVIVVDLNSTDETKEILEKLSDDYDNIKLSNWRECKEILDNVDGVK